MHKGIRQEFGKDRGGEQGYCVLGVGASFEQREEGLKGRGMLDEGFCKSGNVCLQVSPYPYIEGV